MNSPCQDVPRMSKPIDNVHVDLSEKVKHNHLHAEHIKGVSWTYPDKSVGKERLAYLIFSEDLPQTASIGTHREPQRIGGLNDQHCEITPKAESVNISPAPTTSCASP
jgi:hypothetical protein